MFWILVLFGFVAGCIGCATYGAKGVMPNFSSVDKTSLSQKIGDGLLVVSGYAFTNDKDIDKYFDEDLYKHDILPIFVEIQNNAASDVKLVAAVLNLDGASSITPMSQEGVYAVIKRGWAGRSTFWWFFGLYVGAPISAYATHKTNLHIQQDLDEKISELNSQQQDLERQIKEAEKELQKIDEINTIEEEIEQSCLEYQGVIENANFDLKRRILKKWVKEINLPDEGGIIVKVRIPPPEKPIKFGLYQVKGFQHSYTATSEEV